MIIKPCMCDAGWEHFYYCLCRFTITVSMNFGKAHSIEINQNGKLKFFKHMHYNNKHLLNKALSFHE